MKDYAGLDMSLKEISICVVDQDGRVVARGAAPADPEGVAGWLKNRSLKPESIVHESGQLSTWLQRGLVRLGLPAICIDARKAHKSLSARLNKSDAPMPKVWRSSHGRAGSRRSMYAAKRRTGCVPLSAPANA